jgi:hypothetical protein
MPVFAGTAAVPSRRPADSVIDHNILLASTIAAALGLALVLGFIAARVKLPSLVGYLLTGVLIGTFTPGFVADIRLADELAEIGAMLLMFGATWWSSCARADCHAGPDPASRHMLAKRNAVNKKRASSLPPGRLSLNGAEPPGSRLGNRDDSPQSFAIATPR